MINNHWGECIISSTFRNQNGEGTKTNVYVWSVFIFHWAQAHNKFNFDYGQ